MTDWDDRDKADDDNDYLRRDIYEDVQKSSLSYDYCGRHGVRYPSGASCPACDGEA